MPTWNNPSREYLELLKTIQERFYNVRRTENREQSCNNCKFKKIVSDIPYLGAIEPHMKCKIDALSWVELFEMEEIVCNAWEPENKGA